MSNQARQLRVTLEDERSVRLLIAWLDKSYMSARLLSHRIENSSLCRSLMRLTVLKRQAAQDLRQTINTSFPLFVNPDSPQNQPDIELMVSFVESDKQLIDKAKMLVKDLQSDHLAHKVSYWIAAWQMEVEAMVLTVNRLK